MTRQEHLLTLAIEECGEVAQRLSKILRFGITDVQPGQTLTNEERFYEEFCDLRAVLGMAGLDAWLNTHESKALEQAKVTTVTRSLADSAEQGTLTEDARCPSCQSLRRERIAGVWLCQVCGHEWACILIPVAISQRDATSHDAAQWDRFLDAIQQTVGETARAALTAAVVARGWRTSHATGAHRRREDP